MTTTTPDFRAKAMRTLSDQNQFKTLIQLMTDALEEYYNKGIETGKSQAQENEATTPNAENAYKGVF